MLGLHGFASGCAHFTELLEKLVEDGKLPDGEEKRRTARYARFRWHDERSDRVNKRLVYIEL